jgi:ABC-type multidrug transport system ATPase subunit
MRANKMWKMIIGAAQRLNIQIFASTHSLDCIRALADLYLEDNSIVDKIALQRLERGNPEAIPYSAEEILAAVTHSMELRG